MKFNSFLLLATFAGLLIVEGQVKSSEERRCSVWLPKNYEKAPGSHNLYIRGEDKEHIKVGEYASGSARIFSASGQLLLETETYAATTSIADLYEMVAKETGMNVDEFYLIYNGFSLEKHKEEALLDFLGRHDFKDARFFVFKKPRIKLEVIGDTSRLCFDPALVRVDIYQEEATVDHLYAEVAKQTGMKTNEFILQAIGEKLPIELSVSGVHKPLSELGKSYFYIKEKKKEKDGR